MSRYFFAMLVLFFNLLGCGSNKLIPSSLEEAWNPKNDPFRLGTNFVYDLNSLPIEAALDKAPWSDSYWPSYRGGIAQRWLNEDSDSFTYKLYTLDELKKLSKDEIATLSPAEKYDIFVGRYDYPLVNYERSRTNPNAAYWEGLCHGWAPAALLFEEPKPVILTGANDIVISFGSSDIKALLIFYQGQIAKTGAKSLGARCNIDIGADPEAANNPECRDTNAGAFHVVLANKLGLLREGFVADVIRDLEVWNHPIFKFKSNILGTQSPSPGAAPGTIKEAIVETEMTFTVEVSPDWRALVGTPDNAESSRSYKYVLELDEHGYVIGGEWQESDRPDFLWTQSRPEFEGFFSPLSTIYVASLGK